MRHCEFYLVFVVTLVPLTNSLMKLAGLGEDCRDKSDCKANNSKCPNGVCMCNANFTPDLNSYHCIPEYFSNKDNGTICKSLYCKCDEHFMKMDEMCVERQKVHLGEKCTAVKDCLETNSSKVQCLNGICSCGNGYRHVGNDECVLGHRGAPCNASNECDTVYASAYCRQGKCQCKDNYVESYKSNICLKLAKLDEICKESHQCIGNYTECSKSKCQCKYGYRMEAGKCIRNAEIGENCTTNKECKPLSGASYCNNGKCDCKAPEFIKSTQRPKSCLPVSQYGTYCEEVIQCPGNSNCRRGKCECEIGFLWNTNMTCVPESAHLVRGNVWTIIIMLFIFLLY